MAASRTLRRLLRVLEMEEEQAHGALEAALAELHRLETACSAAQERELKGRRLLVASAHTGQWVDRMAGMEEARIARSWAGALKMRKSAAEGEAAALREAFLAKRTEKRQAETLIREAEAREALEAGRRSQQLLDEWFLNRRRRAELAAKAGDACGGEERKAAAKET